MNDTKATDWAGELKTAIAASGMSINQLAKDAGIPQPVLQRFVSGAQGSMRLDNANKLGNVLGLFLVTSAKRGRGRAGKGA